MKEEDLIYESTAYTVGNTFKVTGEIASYIYIGAGLFVVSVALRVGLEGYFTSKYCEELIHKFEEYYIINAQSIGKSYN